MGDNLVFETPRIRKGILFFVDTDFFQLVISGSINKTQIRLL